MKLQEVATEEQKKLLRKIKNVRTPDAVVEAARNTVVKGCIEQGAYIQFARDIELYGLWEALLYVEGYEPQFFRKDSALNGLKAAIKALPKVK